MAETGMKPDIVTRVSEGIRSHMAAEVRAVWDGFDRFCRAELQLPAETVMVAYFSPMLGRIARQRESLDRSDPEPAKVAEYADTLTTGWRRWLGLGSVKHDQTQRAEATSFDHGRGADDNTRRRT